MRFHVKKQCFQTAKKNFVESTPLPPLSLEIIYDSLISKTNEKLFLICSLCFAF